MNVIPLDTTIEAMKRQVEILRKVTPKRRMEMAFELSDFLRSIVQAGVKERHPDYNEQQIEKEVLRLMIGESLFKQIYPNTGI